MLRVADAGKGVAERSSGTKCVVVPSSPHIRSDASVKAHEFKKTSKSLLSGFTRAVFFCCNFFFEKCPEEVNFFCEEIGFFG